MSYTYDNLGETLTKTDQNGTTHTYSYDVLGRLTLDAVTTLGGGVDGSVLALGYTYNSQGLPYQQTSYCSATEFDDSTIVNQVEDVYNGLGQLTGEYQSVSGPVTGNSPEVTYTYSPVDAGSRLQYITYPSGRMLYYGYDGNALDNAIGRVDYLGNGKGASHLCVKCLLLLILRHACSFWRRDAALWRPLSLCRFVALALRAGDSQC